jgi:prolyl-tRNA synthetase
MKDAYSFHTAVQGQGGLDEIYQKQYDAYCRIFERCGLPYVTVEAESGPIGGSASHEFMVPSPTGEDVILESDKNNYAANVEKCEIGPRPHDLAAAPVGELAKVHTPNCASIEDVARFLKTKPRNMLKSLVFQSTTPEKELAAGETHPTFRLTLAIVRGDHDVNEGKVKSALAKIHPNDTDIQLAEENLARAAGFTIGYVGPHAVIALNDEHVNILVDPDAAQGGFWVTGANAADHHVKYFNWQREVIDPLEKLGRPQTLIVADIRNAIDGDASPKNDGGVLHTRQGIEIGHVFKLGDKYTRAMDITILGPDNNRLHPIMGCYGIGVNRILAAAIERQGGHDDHGIIWPASIAPFHVIITPIKYEGQARDVAQKLAGELEAQGLDVLIDDRDERPGVKFKDADLIGIPVRLVLGDKALANNQVELKIRTQPKAELVDISQAADAAVNALKNL